jgi:succinyl-diaminopimelate desuccinylase
MHKQEELIDLTKKLIEIPSVSSDTINCHKVLSLTQDVLNEYNYKEFEHNDTKSLVFYNTKKLPSKFKILLNAHLDVVQGKKELFIPTEKSGKIYGRGAYDMKAAASAEILAFKYLANKIDFPLGLSLVTDEETGGFNGAKIQANSGIMSDFIIVGEYSELQIKNATKGILQVKITAPGKSTHGAYPWLGINAISQMTIFLNKLQNKFPVPANAVWETTVTISTIETTNFTINKVPDDCTVKLDIRFVPNDKDTIINSIKSILPLGFNLEIITFEPSHYTEPDNSFIQSLSHSIKNITDTVPEVIATHGSSDLRHFSEFGVSGVEFGIKGGGQHQDDEWVDIDSIYKYYDILVNFIKKYS